MPIDITIQEKVVPELRVLSKRETGTYEATINKIADELMHQINLPMNAGQVQYPTPL